VEVHLLPHLLQGGDLEEAAAHQEMVIVLMDPLPHHHQESLYLFQENGLERKRNLKILLIEC